jgi:hypothetical protein
VRINAYLLCADPAFQGASVASYYDAVDRIVVCYDDDHLSWSGQPLPLERCFAELAQADPDGKLELTPGRLSHPDLPPMECETRARRLGLAAASEGADWVLQIDGDEVVPRLGVFVEMLERADQASADGLDFPSRWIYARTADGRYLEACSRWWRHAAGYPGALAVRAGSPITHARHCTGRLFRVDFRDTNTDPWRLPDTPVDATVGVDDGVLHLSWVRTPAELAEKAVVSSHRDDADWDKELRQWLWRQRHPRAAVALTPLRRRGSLHPNWLRLSRLPLDPPPSLLVGPSAPSVAHADA